MRNLTTVLLIAIVALLCAQLYQSHQPEQWSYAVIAPRDENLMQELNEAGARGYEIVSTRRVTDGDKYVPRLSYEIILKRRGSSPVPAPASKK